jgi:hypothetical protein
MTPGGPHDWKHDNSVEARIVITAFKFDLYLATKDERHFDIEALRAASGVYVPGWVEVKLETQGHRLPEYVLRIGQDFIERFNASRG